MSLRPVRGVSELKSDSNPLSGLNDHERKIHLDFVSAEKYLKEYIQNKQFKDVVRDKAKLFRAVDSLYNASNQLMEASVSAYTKLSVDQRLWSYAVHQFVSLSRDSLSSPKHLSKKSEIQTTLQEFIDKNAQHFRKLISWLECKFPSKPNLRNGKAEYYSALAQDSEAIGTLLPRILTSLGDSIRYADDLRGAMECFEKARSLDPGNGRVYHQMGIVALIRHDVLSALYNFTLAYVTPVPVEAARVQLPIVFDETLKMYLKVSSGYWYSTGKRREKLHVKKSIQHQIWINSSGFQTAPPFLPFSVTKEEHVRNLSTAELCNRFSLTYVQVIGKIFTNIGLESLHVVAEEALLYLEAILKRNSSKYFPPIRSVHVMTLNMHLLDHLRPKSKTSSGMWMTAVQFAMEICCVFADRLITLLSLCDWDDPAFDVVTVGLGTWVQWMELYPKDWIRRRSRPVFNLRHATQTQTSNYEDKSDETWILFGTLISKLEIILKRFQTTIFPGVTDSCNSKSNVCISPFPECKHMAGFLPFMQAPMLNREFYCDNRRRVGRARNLVRLQQIHSFGIKVLWKKFGLLDSQLRHGLHVFTSSMKVRKFQSESEVGGFDGKMEQFWINEFKPNDLRLNPIKVEKLNPDCNNANKIILKSPKSRIDVQDISIPPPVPKFVLKSKQNFKLWLKLSQKGFRTEIIVQPTKFVLDTNCFLGRALNYVKVLLSLVTKPLIIPVSVILELKGLSKGGLRTKEKLRFGSDTSKHEAQLKIISNMSLAEHSKTALEFIAKNMDYFTIVTSTGRVLSIRSPYAFIRDDYFDPEMKNDDRILDTCKYLEDLNFSGRLLDNHRRIHRETVLLTGDRFLRIKTFAYAIPSRPITSLIFWFLCLQSPKLLERLRKKSKEYRRRLYMERQKKRESKKVQPLILRRDAPTFDLFLSN